MGWQWLAVVAAGIAVIAMVIAVAALRRLGERDPATVRPWLRRLLRVREYPPELMAAFTTDRPESERLAFIVNPTKPGVARLREIAHQTCTARRLPEPIWLYTAPGNTGLDLARQAVAAGADVLIAAGGDGTVRPVAAVAIESGLPLGIIPLGTGNLFARNLDVPLGSPTDALRAIIEGTDSAVDIGRLTVTRESGDEREYLFLVMAGVGIDAEMVAGAGDGLKRRLGWLAYFVAAFRHFRAKRMRASVTVEGLEAVEGKMRTVLIANCGRLPGGLVLVPDARIDDGQLDVATLDARAGVAGWAGLVGEVVMQGRSVSTPTLPDAWRAGRIDHARGPSVEVVMESPERVQADGELLGRAVRIRAVVDAGCLTVRSRGTF